jgi:hypothetical protein
MMSTTKTQASWRDEIRILKVRSMRGGPHSESDPFVALIEVRDGDGRWNRLSVSDEGRGGAYLTEREFKKGCDNTLWYGVREMTQRIELLHAEQELSEPGDEFASVNHHWDVIIGALIDGFEEQKVIEKKMKTCIVFRRKGDRALAWVTCLPTAANIAKIRAKYEGCEILNKDVASDADADAAKHARTQKWVWTQIAKGYLVLLLADGKYYAYRGTTPEIVALALKKHPGSTVVNPGVSKEAR